MFPFQEVPPLRTPSKFPPSLVCSLTQPRAPRASQLVLTGCGALVRPT